MVGLKYPERFRVQLMSARPAEAERSVRIEVGRAQNMGNAVTTVVTVRTSDALANVVLEPTIVRRRNPTAAMRLGIVRCQRLSRVLSAA